MLRRASGCHRRAAPVSSGGSPANITSALTRAMSGPIASGRCRGGASAASAASKVSGGGRRSVRSPDMTSLSVRADDQPEQVSAHRVGRRGRPSIAEAGYSTPTVPTWRPAASHTGSSRISLSCMAAPPRDAPNNVVAQPTFQPQGVEILCVRAEVGRTVPILVISRHGIACLAWNAGAACRSKILVASTCPVRIPGHPRRGCGGWGHRCSWGCRCRGRRRMPMGAFVAAIE